ncbi:MAG TPA: hypothetical protein VHK67_06915, partial [Rhabdochlamydiaceae bacterium]|nr:hypothetical protein [Rhabdochlamydiaceae bacterium]
MSVAVVRNFAGPIGSALLGSISSTVLSRYGFSCSLESSVKVAVVISLFAKTFQSVYSNAYSRKSTTAAEVFGSYVASSAIIVLGRWLLKFNLSYPFMVGLTALSYLADFAASKIWKDVVHWAVKNNVVYLSLVPNYNPYAKAHAIGRFKVDTPEWKHFVKEASGKFSLRGLASQFSSYFSNQLLYPQLAKSCIRDHEQFACVVDSSDNKKFNADDINGFHISERPLHLFAISTADGSGPGEDPAVIAKAVNRGFIESCAQGYRFIDPANSPQMSLSKSKLAKMIVSAVDAAQNYALFQSKKKDGDKAIGCTTHLGVVVAFKEGEDVAHCFFTTVGDSKLLVKYPSGDLVDLTPYEDRKDLRDPGGQLGTKYRKGGDEPG